MKIKATFTYKGKKKEILSSGLVRDDYFTYVFHKDKDTKNGKDPYFEINLYTKWDNQKRTFVVLPKGYVNHFACTEDCKPDWTSDEVKIEFL